MISHWTYKNQREFEVPEGAFGFVYSVEKINPLPGEKCRYIGRKYLTAAKTINIKVILKSGQKITKKKKTRVDSNWRYYLGSCKPMLEEIEMLGTDKFIFKILAFAETKGQVNLLEEMIQFKLDVLIDDSYFNESIGSGSFRGVKITNSFKDIIKNLRL